MASRFVRELEFLASLAWRLRWASKSRNFIIEPTFTKCLLCAVGATKICPRGTRMRDSGKNEHRLTTQNYQLLVSSGDIGSRERDMDLMAQGRECLPRGHDK